LCREFSELYPAAIEFEAENLPRNLPEDISLCLYRVTQETLQNAVEDNKASRARVHIKLENDEIRLTISDGQGPDRQAARAKESIGLMSINERIRAVNGKVKVRSNAEAGTIIEALIPINQEISY
jgi:signal transduction histidine kinase